MSNRLSVLVLCGGQSTEHDISILSARNIIERLDQNKYTVTVAYIFQDGRWRFFSNPSHFLKMDDTQLKSDGGAQFLQISPGLKHPFSVNHQDLTVDCIFPVLHGTNGEDGTMQGLLEILQVPFVGSEALGSAIAMDKDITKRLLQEANIPVVDWQLVRKNNSQALTYDELKKELGATLFVKPNSLGSSVGIARATDEKSYVAAINDAFRYDEFVLVEQAITGREIECSVLGNENPVASMPGEIINHTAFYTFDAKYVDENAATVKTPADLPESTVKQIQDLAVRAFTALRCYGMARVDFFLSADNELYINEVNTIPGFTNISMYPKNWEASGISYVELLDQLIQLGVQRAAFKKSLTRVYARPAVENPV